MGELVFFALLMFGLGWVAGWEACDWRHEREESRKWWAERGEGERHGC